MKFNEELIGSDTSWLDYGGFLRLALWIRESWIRIFPIFGVVIKVFVFEFLFLDFFKAISLILHSFQITAGSLCSMFTRANMLAFIGLRWFKLISRRLCHFGLNHFWSRRTRDSRLILICQFGLIFIRNGTLTNNLFVDLSKVLVLLNCPSRRLLFQH